MKDGITKEQFVEKYAELLRMTRTDIVDLRLVNDDNMVVISYEFGYEEHVNIEGDSAMGIIRDVARRID